MKQIPTCAEQGAAGAFAWLREAERLRVGARLPAPDALRHAVPASYAARATVDAGRAQVRAILERRDARRIVVVGPCSIHDPVAALDYAHRLAGLARAVRDALFVVVRVYFVKPRTTIGWKGLINDPRLDGSHRVEEGLRTARRMLCDINALGLPVATEMLDVTTPHYLSDLVSWAAIGARTTESQVHREMASGLAMPVGFKNGTDGQIDVAAHAILSSMRGHTFIGIDGIGFPALLHSAGNPHAHLVLRGGRHGPNYDAASVAAAVETLRAQRLTPNLLIDCSHANCGKQPMRQLAVLDDVAEQIRAGNEAIRGVMLESFIEEGAQPTDEPLRYGCSITDPCIGWDATEDALLCARRLLIDSASRSC
ncbi:3-deoxy-7-phosphoheptulonate synthase [Burkholderia multivorans]|uniref:3-deoxy-7-phosphoheptulonate synthase n=1 Tax=Burkholderia multivorans TaxID=87883 RepID=UPI001C2313BB|nr:3-deoxy-7-phosphoheptulonate synthase [Burkholderia multivorans]MBU9260550.1 3-deoxy-7-phosphoheptulonate synthase [Burkholderia multivorans]